MPGQRWPLNANHARERAVDAAEDVIDLLFDVAGAIARDDHETALNALKRAHRLLTYLINTLIRAKFGEAPEKLPEEVAVYSKEVGKE